MEESGPVHAPAALTREMTPVHAEREAEAAETVGVKVEALRDTKYNFRCSSVYRMLGNTGHNGLHRL